MVHVENITSKNGRAVPNQFIIHDIGAANGNYFHREIFQSYSSIIAVKTAWANGTTTVTLDREFWDYSSTTRKHCNTFLGETKKETEKKIASGEYVLADLN